MLEHRAGIDFGKRFAGETGRGVPGRDYAQDFPMHTRSYHERLVLDSRQKGKHQMRSRRVPIPLLLAAISLFAVVCSAWFVPRKIPRK